jgi:4-deoxy-L-threo-5-hexosulose-uronate ketol-isomerase
MKLNYEIRYASHPQDVKNYDTERLRKEFLIEKVFGPDEINMVYSFYDRYIAGGAMPVNESLELKTIEPLKSSFFLERREIGIINVGAPGIIKTENAEYELNYKEALYIGKGTKQVIFKSKDKNKPALFYFNSAPAHKEFPARLVSLKDADVAELGSMQTSNERKINKLLVNSVIDICQMQMGLTELKPGSVWNTMPPHVHSRRMEVYFYFEVPDGQTVCHFMGQPFETRHIWMQNNQAVISPNWSIHSAAGTSNYCFIWGMAGENLDYGDMDSVKPSELK